MPGAEAGALAGTAPGRYLTDFAGMAGPSERIEIGGVVFDPVSGELERPGPDGRPEIRRLPPQPARLLALLAARPGEVVSREEIRAELWAGVQVDFDQGLHFCVRQVREALGDTAAESRFIETLPRRGYRLAAPVAEPAGRPPARGRRRAAALLAAGALAMLALPAILWLLTGPHRAPAGAAASPVSVAILPFRPPAGTPAPEGHAAIAERILLRLNAAAGEGLALIGPTTTGAYADGPAELRRLIAEIEPHYVLHGRYLAEPAGVRLLGELIRTADGAHVWVDSYDRLDDPGAIADAIADGVHGRLAAGGPPSGR